MGCPSFVLPHWQRGLSNEGISKHCSLFQKGKAHKMIPKITHTLPKWGAPLPREEGCSPPHPVLYLREGKHCCLSFYSFAQVAPSASHCCQPHLLCRELIYSPGGLDSPVKPPRQGPDMLLMGCGPKITLQVARSRRAGPDLNWCWCLNRQTDRLAPSPDRIHKVLRHVPQMPPSLLTGASGKGSCTASRLRTLVNLVERHLFPIQQAVSS